MTGPEVSIMKESASALRPDLACYTVLTPERPAAILGFADLCETQSRSDLIAGVDQLRLVIDYGDVGFAGTGNAPTPTVQVTVDGKSIDAGVALLPERRASGHTYFVATLIVPNVVTANLQFSVNVNAGFQTNVPTIFRVNQPIQAVTVLKRSNQGCSIVVAGAAPDAALGLPLTCPFPVPLGLLSAGTDQIEIVIDYGAVDFPGASTKIPPPTISVLVDNKDIAAPITVSPAHRVGGHIFFLATLTAPPMLSNNVRFAVSAVPGVTSFLTNIFVLQQTPVSISVVECPASSCEQQGAVGSVHAKVQIQGEVPQVITVRNVIDGLVTDEGLATVTTEVGLGETSKVVEMAVPAAPDGAMWRLEVQFGSSRTRTNAITIRKPTITTSLSCGSACSLAGGPAVGLTVIVPKLLKTHQALIYTTLNGVPILTGSTLDLVNDVGTNTARGITTLTAPTSAGTWAIDVSIAGYRATTLTATIQ